jgi:hypothetical protein
MMNVKKKTIDFELTPEQRKLQLDARAFAKTHLTDLRSKMVGPLQRRPQTAGLRL